MVARVRKAADLAVDASGSDPVAQIGAEQQVVETQAGVALPTLSRIVPEGVDAFTGVRLAQRVGPTAADKPAKCGPALRLDQGVVIP